jgi:glycosyltransferase involved in cell wall biosynthesis
MPLLYRSVDLFLHTAVRESFGNVYIEALGSGTPVIAHDDEVTRWILGDCGYLVDTTSEHLLVDAVKTVLRTPSANAMRGVDFAHSRYSWHSIARSYCDFFAEVLSRRAGRQRLNN